MGATSDGSGCQCPAIAFLSMEPGEPADGQEEAESAAEPRVGEGEASTSRCWMEQAGLTVEREEFVPEGDGGHALFWARK